MKLDLETYYADLRRKGAGSSYTPARCRAPIMLRCMDKKGAVRAADRAMKIRLYPGFTRGSSGEKQAFSRRLARLRMTLFPIFLDTEKPTWTLSFRFRAVTNTKLPPPT